MDNYFNQEVKKLDFPVALFLHRTQFSQGWEGLPEQQNQKVYSDMRVSSKVNNLGMFFYEEITIKHC